MNSTPENGSLNILFQDAAIVAIHKPAGLLVHRSRIDVHATEFAVQKLRDQIRKPVFLVHRLDRPTSGALLFALNSECARILSDQFSGGQVQKTYRAIVRGFTPEQGIHNEALLEKHDPVSDNMAKTNKLPQPAITKFKTTGRWEIPFSAGKYANSRYSEVCIQPLTGRKHQIRRHFNHMAHPVVGDSSHGDTRHNRLFREQLGTSRLLLVATRLKFQHPMTKQPIQIQTAPDEEYLAARAQLQRLNLAKD